MTNEFLGRNDALNQELQQLVKWRFMRVVSRFKVGSEFDLSHPRFSIAT
ncbi:hypothetical protein F2Y95_01830 (plasmid) [Aphanizomenon flos-aquae CCAP 1446/1C]|uniref:Uncharacterized protein n=1 Tax=Anabaena cylindrica (strain ATCC 27899 / PCC 7122) TaxID=272123 RepID=K9ZQM6_ANACC|nr:hypothetical protein Anacy_5791 [Anabaena cylindrica PCC 7122]MBY5280538.1 hypothetical protein [Anabaena sp. CCAP 1446/1C]MBY5308127.1 hypothetical protein [Anabaena sp. CCAP 1446/1C]BAY06539.1 hypothetical protein NIES19_58220 [Anabaena cylindrica PCC 7122]